MRRSGTNSVPSPTNPLNFEKADKYFREALKYEPGSYAPVVNLGGTLLSLKRYEEALKYNLYAIDQRPYEALANSQLGLNYYYLGDEEKAVKYLIEAKRIDPGHFSHPQRVFAEIYRHRGELDKVISEFEDFLARHPDDRVSSRVRQMLVALKKGSEP